MRGRYRGEEPINPTKAKVTLSFVSFEMLYLDYFLTSRKTFGIRVAEDFGGGTRSGGYRADGVASGDEGSGRGGRMIVGVWAVEGGLGCGRGVVGGCGVCGDVGSGGGVGKCCCRSRLCACVVGVGSAGVKVVKWVVVSWGRDGGVWGGGEVYGCEWIVQLDGVGMWGSWGCVVVTLVCEVVGLWGVGSGGGMVLLVGGGGDWGIVCLLALLRGNGGVMGVRGGGVLGGAGWPWGFMEVVEIPGSGAGGCSGLDCPRVEACVRMGGWGVVGVGLRVSVVGSWWEGSGSVGMVGGLAKLREYGGRGVLMVGG
ncbi:hypothetical protein Tco_1474092 [Tanacetum coccineum]